MCTVRPASMAPCCLSRPGPGLPRDMRSTWIIETIMRRAARPSITLCPTGPLTNIALAIIKEPAIVPRLRGDRAHGRLDGAGQRDRGRRVQHPCRPARRQGSVRGRRAHRDAGPGRHPQGVGHCPSGWPESRPSARPGPWPAPVCWTSTIVMTRSGTRIPATPFARPLRDRLPASAGAVQWPAAAGRYRDRRNAYDRANRGRLGGNEASARPMPS